MKDDVSKSAVLYRMAMPGHVCPFGVKARALLDREGFAVQEYLLETRDAVDTFKADHGVKTTPQVFIAGARIGGFSDLRAMLGESWWVTNRYVPVMAIFAATALMALALAGFSPALWAKWFLAFSMAVLAIQKLQDVGGFVNGFVGYDLLAQRFGRYAYAYPFLELYVAVGMMALIGTGSALVWLVSPVGIFIGTIGAVSVIKAVYIDRRDLTCACVGGGSKVPLGFVSLVENLAMVGMGLWMLA